RASESGRGTREAIERMARFSASEAARELGKLGGKARGRALSPERREEIARQGGEARWAGGVGSGRAKTEGAREMGQRGGEARKAALCAEQRREIARLAARVRWQRQGGQAA